MDTAARLELPSLSRGRFSIDGQTAESSGISAYTNERLFEQIGVRIAFTEREGGVSLPPYDSLNLATHVNDDALSVQRNRRTLLSALGCPEAQLIVPNQVHGTHVVDLVGGDLTEVEAAREQALAGADALIIDRSYTAALLNYADCVPIIIVAPTGAFAVVHAGWRGVYAHIVVKALYKLCALASCEPSDVNVYIGAYIHADCFEVSADLANKFAIAFGEDVVPSHRHVDMGAALTVDLLRAGCLSERIADVDICTYCQTDRFFSYRKQAGVCGRHGAFAVRIR